MKIKLDENIPARLVSILSQFGHEIDTIPQEGLIGGCFVVITENKIRIRHPEKPKGN